MIRWKTTIEPMNKGPEEMQRKLQETLDAMTPEQRARSEALLQRLEKYAGRVPLDWTFNRDEANAR